MADSPTRAAITRGETSSKVHSQEWFNVHPDPGNNRSDWCAHLAIKPDVAKALEEQVQSMVIQENLHRKARKPAEESEEIDNKIGKALLTSRPDVFRPHVPKEHFLLIIRRMAKRAIAKHRTSQRESPQTEEHIGQPTTRRRLIQRGLKRKAEEDPDYTDAVDEGENSDSSSSESVIAVEQQPPMLDAVRRAQPVINTPPASIDDHFGSPKIDTKNIWIEITDPEDETNVFLARLSRLSDEEVDIESCANVELEKLLALIREREQFAAWPFFDRAQQYLSWTSNGKKQNCFWSETFQYACLTQIQESLRLNPSTPPKIMFECLPRPQKLKPKPAINASRPTLPPTRSSNAAILAGPSPAQHTLPLSPVSTAIMTPTAMNVQQSNQGTSTMPKPNVVATSPTSQSNARPRGDLSSTQSPVHAPRAQGLNLNHAHPSPLDSQVLHSARSTRADHPSHRQRSNSSSSQGSAPMTVVKGESSDEEALIVRPKPRFGHRHDKTRRERLPVPM